MFYLKFFIFYMIVFCWERLRARGEGVDREWDDWMASMDMSLSKLREIVEGREACCSSWGRKESCTTHRPNNNTVFKDEPPFTVITKYWLYSLCCTACLCNLFYTEYFVPLNPLPPCCPSPHSLSPLVTTSSFPVSLLPFCYLFALVCCIFYFF